VGTPPKPSIPAELFERLKRYAPAHHRTLEMADYIERCLARSMDGLSKAEKSLEVENHRMVALMRSCGDWLHFKHYTASFESRLVAANFCKKHTLCPLCAIRRGSKMLQAYLPRFETVLSEHSTLKPYLVTFTVKDGPELGERLAHLKKSLGVLHARRRDYLKKGRGWTESALALGGVSSTEIKKGKGSGLWHPHAHAVWLCEREPLAGFVDPLTRKGEGLRAEWFAITGDSFEVDVRPIGKLVDGALEVFKYALKFSSLSLPDNWHAYSVTKGMRLIASHGLLHGVKVPESMLDDELDGEFVDYFFKYFNDAYMPCELLSEC